MTTFEVNIPVPEVPPPLATLYFMHAPGCSACAAMKPVVGEFYRQNKGRIHVVPIDLSQIEWRARAWEPDVTPTLLLRFPDGRLSERLEGYDEEEGPKESFKKWFTAEWQKRRHGK